MNDVITLLSVNCQGLGNAQKRRDVFNYLRQKKYSIYLLQDTHFEKKLEPYISAEWGYQCYFASFNSNSRGVAVLFNNNFEFKVKEVYKGEDGNSLLLIVQVNEMNLILGNIYGPNRDNPAFYNSLKECISEIECPNIILAGDWNLVLDPTRDYQNYRHNNNPRAQEAVEQMMSQLDLFDIWRELNPDCCRYTWRRTNPFQQSRLDFFLISDNIIPYVEDADIKCGYRTDHSMIILKLKFCQKLKCSTFWKFNTSLLKDKTFVDEVNQLIDSIVEDCALLPYARDAIKNISKSDIQFTVTDDVFLDFLLMKIR